MYFENISKVLVLGKFFRDLANILWDTFSKVYNEVNLTYRSVLHGKSFVIVDHISFSTWDDATKSSGFSVWFFKDIEASKTS